MSAQTSSMVQRPISEACLGIRTQPLVHHLDAGSAIRYALSLGESIDHLPFLFERFGPKVLPSYASVPSTEVFNTLVHQIGGDPKGIVHGGQQVTWHRPFFGPQFPDAPAQTAHTQPAQPSSTASTSVGVQATLCTIGEVVGVYDLKRMAVVHVKTQSWALPIGPGFSRLRTWDQEQQRWLDDWAPVAAGEPSPQASQHARAGQADQPHPCMAHCTPSTLLFETIWSLIYRFDGGFGGTTPPRAPKHMPPARTPDFSFRVRTTPEQALFYRLNGDLNPLHADPELAASVGFEKPILHGLCTFGCMSRAVLHETCGGEAARLKGLEGQFRRPVFPGDTIIVNGWHDPDATDIPADQSAVLLQVTTEALPDKPAISGARAVIAKR